MSTHQTSARLAILLALLGPGCSTPPVAPSDPPRLMNVQAGSAMIRWTTERPTVGRVLFRLAGTADEPRSATEEFGEATEHEVTLTGLQPGTRYEYWLAGDAARYQFRTQPTPSTPFSFLVVWGQDEEQLTTLVLRERPEFVLERDIASCESHTDRYPGLQPIVPVLPLWPRFCGSFQGNVKFRWGGLKLVIPGPHPATEACDGCHTIGLLDEEHTGAEVTSDPACPVAFALHPGEQLQLTDTDGIHQLTLPTEASTPGALRVDVTVESIRATELGSREEYVLKSPPLGQKRTCADCRRLADQGAYEASVKAYEAFIATHEGHYQIDDAMYAIASILDEKLFRHAAALRWYDELLAAYGTTTLASLARQRVTFLRAHAEHDFAPLSRFERIRRVEYARQRHRPGGRARALAEVRAILAEFPECSLAPRMWYWLANQERADDPDRAVATYRELLARFPTAEYAADAWLEIGDTYYAARRYEEALAAFEQAAEQVPGQAADARAQADRARRNLRRASLATAAWVVLAAIATLGLLLPPVGLRPRRLLRALLAGGLLTAVLGAGAWLIHEQFGSAGERWGFVLGLALAASAGFPFTMGLAEKLVRRSLAGALVLGIALGLAAFLCGAYLTIYLTNEHALVVFRL